MMQASSLELHVPGGIPANPWIGVEKDPARRSQYPEPRPRRIHPVQRHHHFDLRLRALFDQQEEG